MWIPLPKVRYIIQPKTIDILLFLQKHICCGYSLEAPRRGASNEYPQHKFSLINKSNIFLMPLLIWSYKYPAYLELCACVRVSKTFPVTGRVLMIAECPWRRKYLYCIFKFPNNLFCIQRHEKNSRRPKRHMPLLRRWSETYEEVTQWILLYQFLCQHIEKKDSLCFQKIIVWVIKADQLLCYSDFNDWLIDWLTDWLTDWLIDWLSWGFMAQSPSLSMKSIRGHE